MEAKKFDETIREKADGMVAPPFQAAHWERLARALDDATAAPTAPVDDTLDQDIAAKLGQLRAPGSSEQTWPILETRLLEHERLRRRVLMYKSAELVLLLLLLLNVAHWYPRLKPVPQREVLPYAQHSDAADSAPVVALLPVDTRAAFPVLPSIADKKAFAAVPNNSGGGVVPPALASQPKTAPIAALDALEVRKSAGVKPVELVLPADNIHPMEVPSHAVIALPAIASLQFLTEPELEEEEAVFEVPPSRRRPMLNIAMLGGADNNRVMTPPNYQFRLKGFDRYTTGYGGGILLGLEYGRMELGSGLIYSAKQYQPLPVIFVKGSNQKGFVANSLESIQLNLVNLPVYLRYDAIRKDKWRAYVSGGASLQIALGANYFISPPITLPAAGQTPVVEGELEKPAGGWFEGGSFRENSYITANIGLGLERFVSERWSVFAQPTYHQSIGYFANGLGPNLDRIHTLSLWTGIRVRVMH
jgi:hypothetical protein